MLTASDVIYALLIVAMTAAFVYYAAGVVRRGRLDAVGFDEVERKIEEGDLPGALDALMRIVKRHHGR